MLRVVRVVIHCGHRTQTVEALDEHTLAVKVGKAQRALYLMEPMLTRPPLGSGEESIHHLGIIDEVDPAEACSLLPPLLVGSLVLYYSDAAHHLAVAIGKEIVGIAELEGRIAVLAECIHSIIKELGYIVRRLLVQFIREIDKQLQLSVVLYSFYRYGHRAVFFKFNCKYKESCPKKQIIYPLSGIRHMPHIPPRADRLPNG